MYSFVLLYPLVKITLAYDIDNASHTVMPYAAKLRTSYFKLADFIGRKPDMGGHARNNILFDTHRRQAKTMDNILTCQT